MGTPYALPESPARFLIPFEKNLARGKTITGQAVTEVDAKQVSPKHHLQHHSLSRSLSLSPTVRNHL